MDDRSELKKKLREFLSQNFALEERVAAFRERQFHTLEIELTDICNLSCFYCYAESSAKGQALSFEKAKEFLDQARDYGIKQIAWLGGEPTLNPYWADIIAYSRSLGLRNELWSNGTTLNDGNIAKVIDLCDIFVLHLDTIDSVNYSQVQQQDREKTHRKVLDGFDKLLERGFPPSNVRLNVTLTRSILPDLEKTLQYFISERRIQTATLIPVYCIGKGKSVSEDEFIDRVELYKAFWKRAETESRPELMLLGTSEFCKWYQMTTVYITADGDIIPYAGVNLPQGNIYRNKIGCVLRSSFDMLSFRDFVSDNGKENYVLGNCGICENSDYCFGTRANSFFNTGRLDQPDSTCWKVEPRLDNF